MLTKLCGRCLFLLAVAAAAVPAAPAAAQESGESRIIYHREVFQYPRAARPDPFRTIATPAAQGIRLEDLSLRGVMFDPDPQASVAIFAVEGSERRIRARVGDRVGEMRVVAIQPRRVDLLVEEMGSVRREALHLRTPLPAESEGG